MLLCRWFEVLGRIIALPQICTHVVFFSLFLFRRWVPLQILHGSWVGERMQAVLTWRSATIDVDSIELFRAGKLLCVLWWLCSAFSTGLGLYLDLNSINLKLLYLQMVFLMIGSKSHWVYLQRLMEQWHMLVIAVGCAGFSLIIRVGLNFLVWTVYQPCC